MTAKIYINGVIGKDTTLLDVIRQFKSFANPTDAEVIIDSVGGFVSEGMAIYNYLRQLQIPVKTIAKKAYSIAASVFMAGDERAVEKGERKVMLHFPWGKVEGGAETFEQMAKELRKIEKDFTDFYSKYTSIDEATIANLLEKETFLSGDEAFDLGLATVLEIPLQAVAMINQEELNEEENKTMEQNLKNKFIQMLQNLFKEDEIVALIIQDANGAEIDFPELSESDTPEVGSKAQIDGKDAEGEYVMPSGEKYVFEAGELKEIIPVEEEVEEESQEEEEIDLEALLTKLKGEISNELNEGLKEQNEALKTEISALQNELKEVKKLMGSEEPEITAKQRKTNTKTSGSSMANALRG